MRGDLTSAARSDEPPTAVYKSIPFLAIDRSPVRQVPGSGAAQTTLRSIRRVEMGCKKRLRPRGFTWVRNHPPFAGARRTSGSHCVLGSIEASRTSGAIPILWRR